MLKASGDTRRRFFVLGGAMALILGGMTLGSVLQRQANAPPPSRLPFDADIAIRRYRNVSNILRKLAVRHAWKEITTLVVEDCGEGEPCDDALRFSRFEAWMRLGNPEKALADRAHLPFERNASGMACALAILGNREEYLAQTGALLKDIDPASLNATDSNNTAWACVLMPGATPDPEKVVALARTGAAGAQGDELPNYLNTLGIALYRTGRDAEAIQVLARAEAISENPYNRVFLAMAHHRLGHKEVSLGYAKAFRTHMDESFGRTEAARHEKVLFLRELNSTMPPTPELAKPESPRPTKLAR